MKPRVGDKWGPKEPKSPGGFIIIEVTPDRYMVAVDRRVSKDGETITEIHSRSLSRNDWPIFTLGYKKLAK